jgi:hypothetical protein
MTTLLCDEQRKIEGMYQRGMNLRDSVSGSMSDKDESRYARAYRHAFNQSHDVEFFKAMTRAYRRQLRVAAQLTQGSAE